ncbi:hypothetical protein HDU91_005612 [Kappamyces sp. JEL0680]|nr:hypothetical protein HDU91_005612 [Kappamyces sp. JEL0680]
MMQESNEKSNREKAKRAAKQAARQGYPIPAPAPTSPTDASTMSFIEKLENEVQLLMRLDHPNVIKTYQVIDSEEECFVVMQFASGGEMMEYMAVKAYLSEKEARRFFGQLVSGLDHIHQANIVHRDLKLENLLLDDKGNVLISDFGLGRTFDADRIHLLDVGWKVVQPLGIPYIGVKSDIWALGVILYFFVTGEAPFKGNSISELYDNIKAVRYVKSKEFSSELRDLFEKILQKNPHDRITLDGIRRHPWMHMDGHLDIPVILPKVSGKVDASKLGQIVKSINSGKEYVAYTFNYHELPKKQSNKLEELKTRGRSNSAVVARRKSISINNGTRPNIGTIEAASNVSEFSFQPGSSAQGDSQVSSNSQVEATQPSSDLITAQFNTVLFSDELPDEPKRSVVVSRSPPEAPQISYSFSENEEYDASRRSSVAVRESVSVFAPAEQTSDSAEQIDKRTTLSPANSDTAPRRRRAATYTSSRLGQPPVAVVEQEEDEKEEAKEQPSKLVQFHSHLRSGSYTKAAEEEAARKKADEQAARLAASPPIYTPISAATSISSASGSMVQIPDLVSDKSRNTKVSFESTPLTLVRRLSMVSPPEDRASTTFQEDNNVAKLTVEAMGIEEIAAWHETHRPPKEIRTVKFAFRRGTSSAVLDPATMFQDLHKVLLSLPETQAKKLTFKRHPDYYDFTCLYATDDAKEAVKFDIEICKVWLLDVHALKMKRRSGNAYIFKSLYDKIVRDLNW